jgi:hypothetical protein
MYSYAVDWNAIAIPQELNNLSTKTKTYKFLSSVLHATCQQ